MKMLLNSMFLLSVSIISIQCAKVRLDRAADLCAGTVVVYLKNNWGTVCDTLWDLTDAAVVCRELNCGVPLSAPGGSTYGVDKKWSVQMTEVRCSGHESSLIQCPYNEHITDRYCRIYKAAGVQCSGPDIFRLVNGPTPCSGRLEFRYRGTWGTVCDDSWDQNDAAVACRQMWCSTLVEYRHNPSFGKSRTLAYLGDFQCKGNEVNLLDCPHRGHESNYCPTGRDAGVTCASVSDKVRLVNSGDPCTGRVEIRNNKQWETVCSNNWDMRDAAVVCRELGCGAALTVDIDYKVFGNGVWPVRMSDNRCTGNESSLSECPQTEVGFSQCSFRKDRAVMCTEKHPLNPDIHKVPISVDKKTASWRLTISSDGKEIDGSEYRERIPTGAQSLETDVCVLGSEAFTSGSWYWEVTITRRKTLPVRPLLQLLNWTVGVAKSSVDRSTSFLEPKDGVWAVCQFRWQDDIQTNFEPSMSIARTVRTLGIFLIYEEALILFYDAETKKHLYTFTANFAEKIYPYFCARNGAHIQLS